MKIIVILVIAFGGLVSCNSKSVKNKSEFKTFKTKTTFSRSLFETQKECDEARKQFLTLNCDQSVTFEPNGNVSLLYTDIMNSGSYSINSTTNVITLTFDTPGDANSVEKFDFISDTEIKDDSRNSWRVLVIN